MWISLLDDMNNDTRQTSHVTRHTSHVTRGKLHSTCIAKLFRQRRDRRRALSLAQLGDGTASCRRRQQGRWRLVVMGAMQV